AGTAAPTLAGTGGTRPPAHQPPPGAAPPRGARAASPVRGVRPVRGPDRLTPRYNPGGGRSHRGPRTPVRHGVRGAGGARRVHRVAHVPTVRLRGVLRQPPRVARQRPLAHRTGRTRAI